MISGATIRQLRLKPDAHNDVAKVGGVPATVLSAYRRGRRQPGIKLLHASSVRSAKGALCSCTRPRVQGSRLEDVLRLAEALPIATPTRKSAAMTDSCDALSLSSGARQTPNPVGARWGTRTPRMPRPSAVLRHRCQRLRRRRPGAQSLKLFRKTFGTNEPTSPPHVAATKCGCGGKDARRHLLRRRPIPPRRR